MAEELFVDVHYQGLELGSRLRMEDFAATQAYLHHPTPMPVGSTLLVDAGGLAIPVQVARVNEQVAGSERPAGMFVTPLVLPQGAQQWWDARVAETELPVSIVEVVAAEPASIESPDSEPAAEGSAETMTAVDSDESSEDTQVMEAVAINEDAAAAADDSAAKGKKKRRRKKRATKA